MSEASKVEDDLARKYRQPKSVEQFGVEAIPDELRNVRWWDMFAIFLNFLVNPGTITISGLLIANGLSLWWATLTGVLSILVGFSVYLVAATVGVDYAIPGLVSMRSAFGIRGAHVASIARTFSSIYWFAFQTVAAAAGIGAILHVIFHRNISVIWISVACALAQLVVSIYGYNALMKLSRFAFVYKIVFSAVIVFLLMTFPREGFAPHEVFSFGGTHSGTVALIILWTIAWGTSWFTNFTDAADFCRYTRSRKEMWFGTISAAIVGQLICSFIGGYAVAAMGGHVDSALTPIVDATRGITWLLMLLLIYIVLDVCMVNVQNLYTAGLALSALVDNLGRFWGTLLVGILGILLSTSQNLISGFDGYMNLLGNIFAPMAGVFVVHYVVLSRWRIVVPDLVAGTSSRYWYWKGVNWIALACTAIGFVINMEVSQQYANILVSAAVAGGIYLIVVKLIVGRSEPLANAVFLPSDTPRTAGAAEQMEAAQQSRSRAEIGEEAPPKAMVAEEENSHRETTDHKDVVPAAE